MVSSASPAAPAFNLNEAFAFVFRSPAWFGKILIGTLCVVTSFLLIPSWILYGYMIQISRGVRSGERVLPSWDHVAANLVDGLLYNIALFLWSLPIVVLILIGVVISGCASSGEAGATTSCSNGGGLALFITLGVLLSLVLVVIHPAVYAQFVAGGFGAAFHFGEVFARVGRQFGLTLLMLLVGILASLVAFLGLIAFLVGICLTIPYAQFVLGHAYGQYTRLSDPPGAVTP